MQQKFFVTGYAMKLELGQAADGTIRKAYAESIEANSVHGSDSDENAKIEIDFFFKPEEIVG